MRKTNLFLLSLGIILCASTTVSASATFTDNRTTNASTAYEDSDFEAEEFLYENSSGNLSYYVAVTNNSETTVEVKGTANGLDADGNILGIKKMSIDVLAPGETSIGCFWFGDVEGVASVDYTLTYEQQTYYEPVINNLALAGTINDSNITITATNNGDYNAQFVQAYALFLDSNGKVIKVDSGYLTDIDDEIKIGATLAKQLNCSDEFADVKVFLTGRSDGATNTASDFDESMLEITEYKYSTSSYTNYYLAMTNNSEQAIEISGNGLAINAEGNILGASDMSVNILGPGEQTIADFYFSDVDGDAIDHVEYTLSFNTDPYYIPVIKNLSVDTSVNSNNVIATVTNNGDYEAEFVQVFCLFMDANNNVVNANHKYATDEDNQIKPGSSIPVDIGCRNSFDHIEVFLTGRKGK